MIWHRRNSRTAQEEAEQALRASVEDLHRTIVHGREVKNVAARLREIQQENHFAEAIRYAYSRGRD